MTLKQIKEIMTKINPILEDDPAYMTGVVLLSALETGQDVRKIAKFTEYDLDFIRRIANACRTNGIWKNGKTHANWRDKSTGAVEFICDVLVAQGLLMRVK